jgi:1-acyl-sn-glycerol-3-phosphate acyltransferase
MGVFILVLALLALWSFAEAFSWPVAPDAALAAVVFIWPSLAIAGTGAVVLGTMIGGALAITLYRRGQRWPLPLVTDRMKHRVAQWLDAGPRGLIYQPLTAVPYKAFVVDAADRPFRLPTWSAFTGVFRGLRMGANTILAVWFASIVERFAPANQIPQVKALVLVGAAALFLIGWRVVFMIWRRPSESETVPATVGDRS